MCVLHNLNNSNFPFFHAKTYFQYAEIYGIDINVAHVSFQFFYQILDSVSGQIFIHLPSINHIWQHIWYSTGCFCIIGIWLSIKALYPATMISGPSLLSKKIINLLLALLSRFSILTPFVSASFFRLSSVLVPPSPRLLCFDLCSFILTPSETGKKLSQKPFAKKNHMNQ